MEQNELNAAPAPATAAPVTQGHVAAVEDLNRSYDQIKAEMAKVIVGQHEVLEQLMISLLCRGHCILEGVPGLAKTYMISTLAKTLSLSFHRIQFTPDLMPSDITGTEVIEEDKSTGVRQLRFVPGPIFANVVLADEINRTPPKTQSALLEAMQERQVTAGGFPQKLPVPFFVLATQNPIEQEGTYPLPEAQLDRFLFKVLVGYPSEEEEISIVKLTTSTRDEPIQKLFSAKQLVALQETVLQVPCADHVIQYAAKLVRATRRGMGKAPKFIEDYVAWGAGPRASQNLILAAKARAVLRSRFFVSVDDVRAVAHAVLRHRIITNFNAEAEGIHSEEIVTMLLDEIPADPSQQLDPALAERVFAKPPKK